MGHSDLNYTLYNIYVTSIYKEVFCSYNMLVQEIIVFVNRFTWCSTVYSQVSNSVDISIISASKLAVQTDIISFLNSFFCCKCCGQQLSESWRKSTLNLAQLLL